MCWSKYRFGPDNNLSERKPEWLRSKPDAGNGLPPFDR
jgi:hypothetical protein